MISEENFSLLNICTALLAFLSIVSLKDFFFDSRENHSGSAYYKINSGEANLIFFWIFLIFAEKALKGNHHFYLSCLWEFSVEIIFIETTFFPADLIAHKKLFLSLLFDAQQASQRVLSTIVVFGRIQRQRVLNMLSQLQNWPEISIDRQSSPFMKIHPFSSHKSFFFQSKKLF